MNVIMKTQLLIGGVILLAGGTYLYRDYRINADDLIVVTAEKEASNSKHQFKPNYIDSEFVDHGIPDDAGSSGNSNVDDYDNWGGYPADYYAFMYAYESADPLGLNAIDGGFGPYQATEPIDPLITGIYEYDPDFFSWWKPFHDDPFSYCRKTKWSSHSTVAGSTTLREAAKANLKTPDDYMKWFMACYSTIGLWRDKAIELTEKYLGKPHTECGHGTIALAIAVRIRKSSDEAWKYCTVGMSEDEYIDALIRGIKEVNPSNISRWKCSGSLAKKLNDEGDHDHPIQCDGSCGVGPHTLYAGRWLEKATEAAKVNAGWSE